VLVLVILPSSVIVQMTSSDAPFWSAREKSVKSPDAVIVFLHGSDALGGRNGDLVDGSERWGTVASDRGRKLLVADVMVD
jgi:hypothetical protein